jgi:hypothetical protein
MQGQAAHPLPEVGWGGGVRILQVRAARARFTFCLSRKEKADKRWVTIEYRPPNSGNKPWAGSVDLGIVQ